MHSHDMASASLFVMEKVPLKAVKGLDPSRPFANTHINVGTGVEHSIAQIAEFVQGVVQYEGEVAFDRSKPDGTPRKLLDTTRLSQLGWKARIPLEEGIRSYYQWYLEQ